ncbi:MAG: NAD(P)H-dependent oxidoreductase [bacterium]
MTRKPTILAFAGSARRGSYNRMLLGNAVEYAEHAGADVTLADLNDFPLPIYNADLETAQGIPEPAVRFKRLMTEHDGFLIATPEYNSMFTPLIKNLIDWSSRRLDGEPPYHGFEGKVAAILAASPGALGGLRSAFHLRALLSHMRVLVIPDQKTVPRADNAFDADGRLIDERTRQAVQNVAVALVQTIIKLKT